MNPDFARVAAWREDLARQRDALFQAYLARPRVAPLLRGLAAQACIGAHALLGLFQLGGQADGRHHVQPLAVGVHHADAAARGAELRGDAMQERRR